MDENKPFSGRVLGKRVLLIPASVQTESKGGLILTEDATEKRTMGEVFLIGKEVTEVLIGETVVYNKHSGTEFSIRNKKYVIVFESEISFVLEQEEK